MPSIEKSLPAKTVKQRPKPEKPESPIGEYFTKSKPVKNNED